MCPVTVAIGCSFAHASISPVISPVDPNCRLPSTSCLGAQRQWSSPAGLSAVDEELPSVARGASSQLDPDRTSRRDIGATCHGDRGGPFEKSQPSPPALVGCGENRG